MSRFQILYLFKDEITPRTRMITRILEESGFEISPLPVTARWNRLTRIKFLREELKKRQSDNLSAILIGDFCHKFVLPVCFLARRVPVIYDLFISNYDNYVLERKRTSKLSLKSLVLYLREFLGLRLVTTILADTEAHKNYYVKLFRIPPDKIKTVYVGAEEDSFFHKENQPEDKDSDKFEILFYGNYVPLHGIEYIIQAAKILQKDSHIHFTIVGGGQTKLRIGEMATSLQIKNVTFIERVPPYEDLNSLINSSDLCLGIFGNTGKTQRVIPNKVFQCLAARRCVLTADTSAIREIFNPGNDIAVCPAANPELLAARISELKAQPDKRNALANQGYKQFKAQFAFEKLSATWKEIMNVTLMQKVENYRATDC